MEIFGTGLGQSRTVLRFGFDPKTDVFGFCCVFWYHNDLMVNEIKKWFIAVKGPKGALFLWVRNRGHFVCYCLVFE